MNPPGLKHRLCAILAADAAGFARLMTADDHATVAALDAARAVFRLQVDAHQGRVIDMAGDSVLAVFETAAGAVAAALAAQEELADLVADVPEDRCMRFRIGVHLGDVIEKPDGTVYDTMARDVYALGYYLAHYKYRYLRLAYLFFLTGFVMASLVQIWRLVAG